MVNRLGSDTTEFEQLSNFVTSAQLFFQWNSEVLDLDTLSLRELEKTWVWFLSKNSWFRASLTFF